VFTDQLYDLSERHLPLDEALRRISPAFRRVCLDRALGDAKVLENYERMAARGTPELILQSQRALLGSAAWISVNDEDTPDGRVEFLLLDHVDVWINFCSSADRDRLRPLVCKIAGLLGYQIAPVESQDAEPGAAADGEGM
jgi:hypothetical protein